MIFIFTLLLLALSSPIQANQEIVLKCFENSSETCELSGLEKIEIKNKQEMGDYIYFLRLENQGEETCQPNLELISDFTNTILLKDINLTIKNYEDLIFTNNLVVSFDQSINLLEIAPHQNSFYRLIFSLTEFSDEIAIYFDLTINLNCHPPEALEVIGEVLGEQTEELETSGNKLSTAEALEEIEKLVEEHPMKKIIAFLKKISFISTLIFLFLLVFFIFFQFFIFLDKLLTNSKKGGSDDKKQGKNV